MKVYISGPMRGLPEKNRPAFNTAAERWTLAGHKVFNPATLEKEGRTYADYMRLNIKALLKVEAVVVLRGWEDSEGASLEVAIAQCLDIPIYYEEQYEP